jgi:hypothetical protein
MHTFIFSIPKFASHVRTAHSAAMLARTPTPARKQALLDDLSELGEEEAALLDQHFANMAAQLASIRTYNSAIPVTHTFETNQKAINEIGIKMALGEPLLQSDLTTLENIADQSESSAGTTQWRAASMLPCRDGVSSRSSSGERRRELVEMAQKENNQQFTVAPNPADDKVRITFKEPFTGVVALLDVTGRVMQQFVLDANSEFTFDTQRLPNGIYYLHSRGNDQRPQSTKLVVAH